MDVRINIAFEKASPRGEVVAGWASVVSVDGKPVEDHQGDIISIDEIRKAAHRFVRDARVAKAQHSGDPVGEVVESVIVDDALAKALGASDGKRGWWIVMKVHDPKIQERIRKGELAAFSIGGKGRRTKIQEKR
jgi:hypothetical protein